MAYDYQKVQAWLAQVPTDDQSALHLWLACLDAHHVRFHEGTTLWQLLNEFRTASLWERTNMLYGLKDIADKVMAYDIHCYSRQARQEDEANDSELQRILAQRKHDEETLKAMMARGASIGCRAPNGTCKICGEPWDKPQFCLHVTGVTDGT